MNKHKEFTEFKNSKIRVGSCYIDCGYIPRVCIARHTDVIQGRSLIDGSIGGCSVRYCSPKWVHPIIAKRWATTGPLNKKLKQFIKNFYNSSVWQDKRDVWWKD